jgi:hypothetical protein
VHDRLTVELQDTTTKLEASRTVAFKLASDNTRYGDISMDHH